MLGEAAVWRPDKPTPTAEQVMADPRYALYLAGWPRPGDYGLVAEQGGPVGAAWYRGSKKRNIGLASFAKAVPELPMPSIPSPRPGGSGGRFLTASTPPALPSGCAPL